MTTKRLASKWSIRHRKGPRQNPRAGNVDSIAKTHENLGTAHAPEPFSATDISRLFRQPESHELESLIEEAIRQAATLKQLRDRAASLSQSTRHQPTTGAETLGIADPALGSDQASSEDFFHAHEQWSLRLRTLEMIATARSSLRTLGELEPDAVWRARQAIMLGSTT